MRFTNDLLLENPLRSSGCNSFFVLAVLWAVTALAASGQTLTTLHNFSGRDGARPQNVTLTQGRDGNLYGTTVDGGTSSACGSFRCGTAFKVSPQGALSVFSFDFTHGWSPVAGLALGNDGLLYGTASLGGASAMGDVFSLNPQLGTLTVLHSFAGPDGSNPQAPLALGSGGNYYGTTETGGANNAGTVFSVTPLGAFTLLHSFSGTDGSNPSGAGLMLGPDGALYAVTSQGGALGYGTIFKITPSGAFKTIYNFDGTHGANPYGTLLLASDGNVYGTTSRGGDFNQGTVFKLTPAGVVTFLHRFDPNEGSPATGLVQATDGNLYGTTAYGGALGYGTIFSITTGGTFAVLYNFDNVHGANPYGGLMQHTNGKLCGTTTYGGIFTNCGLGGCGTVFSFDMGLGPFVKFLIPYGNVGSVGQILGNGLTGATAVSFNGVPAASFKVILDTYMTATVPAGATTGPVTVTTPTGTLTSNVNFTVLP
jgi:uncharacterized repeat protein (TIGR03803 family)